MKGNSDLLVRMTFLLSVATIACVGAFFILNNAYWLVSDDAIVIQHTGWGRPFYPTDFTIPSCGRFFPLAYMSYDICLLFCNGRVSPLAHYMINTIGFLLFVGSLSVLSIRILNGIRAFYKYGLTLCFVAVSVEIAYPMFILVRSTMWIDYTLVALFSLLCHCFFDNYKWVFGVCALLCINCLCYCYETNFLLPLSLGACLLLFGRLGRKELVREEIIFSWLLIGSGVLYLLLYCILVLPYIEEPYDSSHGNPMGIVSNALTMIWKCKILLFAIVCFLVRIVVIILNKKECTLYDALMGMSIVGFWGCFALRFNLDNYYILSVLVGMPAVLYCSVQWLKNWMSGFLWALLALLFVRPVGSEVKHNQRYRKETWSQVNVLSNKIDLASGTFCYEPNIEGHKGEITLRNYKYDILCVYLGWLRQDVDYTIKRTTEFVPSDNTIWLNALENEVLFPHDKQLEVYGKKFYWAGWIDGYWVMERELVER